MSLMKRMKLTKRMRPIKKPIWLILLVSGSFVSFGLGANERELGERLISEKGCITCHDKSGRGTADINPNLGGQWKAYMVKTMVDIQKGIRQSPVMAPLVKDLTIEEIRAMAAYYSAQDP